MSSCHSSLVRDTSASRVDRELVPVRSQNISPSKLGRFFAVYKTTPTPGRFERIHKNKTVTLRRSVKRSALSLCTVLIAHISSVSCPCKRSLTGNKYLLTPQ